MHRKQASRMNVRIPAAASQAAAAIMLAAALKILIEPEKPDL